MPNALAGDVLRVLYEADESAVEQIHAASDASGTPTLVRSDFVGRPGGRVGFVVNYCPFTSSAFPIAPEYQAYVTSVGGRDYVLGEAAQPIRFVELETKGLDEIVFDGSEAVPAPDLLSLDTQGAERDILEGASRLLSQTVLAIQTEVQFHEVYVGAATFGEISSLLGRFGFKFIEFDHLERYSPRRSPLGLRGPGLTLFGDAVFFKDPQAIIASMSDRAGLALRKLAFVALSRGHLDVALSCLDRAPAEEDGPAYLRLVEEFRRISGSAPQQLPWRFVEAFSAEASAARFRVAKDERIAEATMKRAQAEFEAIVRANPPLAEAGKALALVEMFNRYGLGDVAKQVQERQRDAVDRYIDGVMRLAGIQRIDIPPG